MKIALFGANGSIGTHVINIALNQGDEVTAYVRRADAISLRHDQLNVVVGDLQNENLIEQVISDADVVISTLGPYMEISRKVKKTPISDGYEVIIKVMKRLNKKRFISIGTPTIRNEGDRKDFNNVVFPFILKVIFPVTYFKTQRMGEIVRNSGLDWTVVRFIDPKVKHKDKQIGVTLDGTTKRIKISRKSIASFIYKVAFEKLYIKQMPTIFYN